MGKVPVHDHTLSYQAISTKSPHGLQCLKALFSEYDSSDPSRMRLNSLLSRDFQDTANGNDRSVGREEAIESIISERAKCTKHQIDLKYALCVENSGSSHTVFFEGVRFLFLEGDSDWTRIPISGRLEVRIKENRFSLKEAVAEIASRKMTSDDSQLVRRDLTRPSMTAISLVESPVSNLQHSTSQIALPGVPELPAVASTLTDNKSLPPYNSPEPLKGFVTGTPTVTTGSSVDGEPFLKQ